MMRTCSFPCALRNKAAMKLFPTHHHLRTASSRSTIMHLHPLASIVVAAASSSSAAVAAAATRMPLSSPSPKPKTPSLNPNPNPALCKHSPSATLDLLILILVLFSGAFLLTSYFTYIFHSLSLLLPSLLVSHSASFRDSPLPYILGFLISFTVLIISVEICCGFRSRKCGNPMCKGLKKAMEFDLQLQTDECVKSGSKEIDRLPWKGGSEGNPDYECLRAELRKMAPPNGRAVLLFRARCGCPIAKLEGWGPKRGRRHKKSVAAAGNNGVGGSIR